MTMISDTHLDLEVPGCHSAFASVRWVGIFFDVSTVSVKFLFCYISSSALIFAQNVVVPRYCNVSSVPHIKHVVGMKYNRGRGIFKFPHVSSSMSGTMAVGYSSCPCFDCFPRHEAISETPQH